MSEKRELKEEGDKKGRERKRERMVRENNKEKENE